MPRPRRGVQSLDAAPGTRAGSDLRQRLQEHQRLVAAGDAGLPVAAPCDALASSSSPQRGRLTSKRLHTTIGDKTLESGKVVEIGDDVWVGGGAIICPGVQIGARSVIGAGSVVTRDIPDCVFAAGNPCRVVREIGE